MAAVRRVVLDEELGLICKQAVADIYKVVSFLLQQMLEFSNAFSGEVGENM